MERYTWTAEQDAVIRGMILEGKTVADICDRMGCTDTQLKNHVAVVRRRDPSFPTLCGEGSGEARFALDENPGEAQPSEAATEEKKGALNPLEQEMADIIAENNATIEGLREELTVEKEARAAEAQAYQGEIKRLENKIKDLEGTVSDQEEKSNVANRALAEAHGELETTLTALTDLREQAAEENATPDEELMLCQGLLGQTEKELAIVKKKAEALTDMLRERDAVIYSMAKTIFLG